LSDSNNILKSISSKKGQVAILIDPEKCADTVQLADLLKKALFANIDYLFVGGSTVTREEFIKCIDFIKSNSTIPVVIFPGASHQISEKADALLYLSLISGRNPDYLIGHHVLTASEVYDMDIEVLPTGYILIEGGTNSSVAYVSQTTPIPGDKSSIILNTSKAGLLQGKQILFFDAGSGAKYHVPCEVIHEANKLGAPIIVGGGIRTLDQIKQIHIAGANVAVIGNKIEEDIDFLLDIKSYIEEVNG